MIRQSENDRWDRGFLAIAYEFAKRMSKDPNTQVGAVLVGPGREVLSMGFNGFPKGIRDTSQRLNDRVLKNKLMVHAERNAICLAARRGVMLQGATLYMVATDESGLIWGGSPCTACVLEIIQAGIISVVSPSFKSTPSKWFEDISFAKTLLDEANILYREITPHQNAERGSFW